MAKRPEQPIAPDMAGMLNLMMVPAGLMAGGAAVALGAASQAFGLWAGAMAGSMETAMRMMEPLDDATPRAKAPVARTRAAVDTLMVDAESTAREVVKAAGGVAEKVKRPAAGKAVSQGAGGSAPRSMPRPQQPDDLKAITGIGPKLEEVLNGLGVWTHAQIAAWNAAEVEWIEDYLAFKGRIARDGWIEQAAGLSARGGDGK